MCKVYNFIWDFTMLSVLGLTIYHLYRLWPHLM